MAAKSKPDFRQYTVSLIKRRKFVALSPTAKATYFVLMAELPTYGMDLLVMDTIRPLVGCTEEELAKALVELEAAELLERDEENGVYWLRGDEASTNWRSPGYVTFYQRQSQGLPADSRVVQKHRDYLSETYGITQDGAQRGTQRGATDVPQGKGEVEGKLEDEGKKKKMREVELEDEEEADAELKRKWQHHQEIRGR